MTARTRQFANVLDQLSQPGPEARRFERDILAGQSVGDYVLVPREQIEKLANKQDGYGMAYHAKGIGSNGSAEIHLYGKRAEAAHWLMQNGLSLVAAAPSAPASDSPAIPEDYNGNRPNTYVPPLPKGMKLLAVDAVIGAFAYINHAGTWQGMPNPLPTPASHTAPDAGDDGGPVDSKAKQIGDANGDPNWWRYIAQARAALATPAPSRDEVEKQREALAIGEKFVNACFSVWSCGGPAHRVRTMLDLADEFRAALNKDSGDE